jgi:hypothetical protein
VTLMLPERRPLARPARPALRVGEGRAARKHREGALQMTGIHRNRIETASSVTAWYVLPPVNWAFRPDAERQAMLTQLATVYADRVGARIHTRYTTMPYPAAAWVDGMIQDNPYPLPDVPGAPTWRQQLNHTGQHIAGRAHTVGLTMIGIEFAKGQASTQALVGKIRRSADTAADVMDQRIEACTAALAVADVDARPASDHDMAWLLYRSIALGLSHPDRPALWGGALDFVLDLVDSIDRFRGPYDRFTRYVNRLTGDEAYVAVLAVGRTEPLTIPEYDDPWMYAATRLGFPVEWSSRVQILDRHALSGKLAFRVRMLREQVNEYRDRGRDAPPDLARRADLALTISDQINTGRPVDAHRAHGHHRVAVYGATRREATDRVRALAAHYNRHLRLRLVHAPDQPQLANSFIPGEPAADTGYLRRYPVRLYAAGMPHATDRVGDATGDLIGRVGTRPVHLNPHHATEVREASGVTVIVADPGGGKSTLMGAMGYQAVRRGVQVTLLDPSGPLARLAELPELRPYTRVLDLAGAEPGTLAPYALVPQPIRPTYPDTPAGQREYEQACEYTPHERRSLVRDIIADLLPPQFVGDKDVVRAIFHALREVPADESTTLEDVIDQLDRQDGQSGPLVGELLADAAALPLARLFFGQPPAGAYAVTAPLTIITMAGLRLPDPALERQHWPQAEAHAVPVLNAAYRLAVRRCYGGDMRARKLVGLDESHFVLRSQAGVAFLVRLARDSRKWNIAALIGSQNPADILRINDGGKVTGTGAGDFENLVSTVFVGRVAKSQQIATDALRLLRLDADARYEQTVAGLSAVTDPTSVARQRYREFLMRDVDGRIQKVQINFDHLPDLMRVLDTTPGGTR